MITKTFKTVSGRLQVSIPDSVQEISLAQLMQLQRPVEMSDLEALNILSGVAVADLQGIKNFSSLQQFNEHVLNLAAQIKEAYDSDSLPKKLTFMIDGVPKTVEVISNLSVEPAGAFLAAREIIADELEKHIALTGAEGWEQSFNPSLNACALVLAHYFYVRVTGKPYNEYHAEAFLPAVKNLPFTDVLPVAKYFFLSYPNLSKPKISCWQHIQLLWKKRLALNSLESLGT